LHFELWYRYRPEQWPFQLYHHRILSVLELGSSLSQYADRFHHSSKYTHIHWAFATISDSWDVSINDSHAQGNDFKKLQVKRMISFGGWGYSTHAGTYDRLQQALNPSDRGTFIDNTVSFVNSEGLDGVDFDW
jgi:GH18 family chitinase